MKTFCIVLLAVFLQLNHALPSESLHRSSKHQSFIINGENAKIGEFPHQLAITNIGDDFIFCGAALISSTQAFTAAHCIQNEEVNNIRVVAGLTGDLNSPNVQVAYLEKMVMDPKFQPQTTATANDFAILTFKNPLNLNKYVQPIAWNQDENVTFTGENCVLSGWGLDAWNNAPKDLKKVVTRIITNKECKKDAPIHDTNICAHTDGFGACTGDSGGPMTCQHNGRPILAGVTSFVYIDHGKCKTEKPSVYSRISKFNEFIQNNLDN